MIRPGPPEMLRVPSSKISSTRITTVLTHHCEESYTGLNDIALIIANHITEEAPNPFDVDADLSEQSVEYRLIRRATFTHEERNAFKAASRNWDKTHGWRLHATWITRHANEDHLILTFRPITLEDLVGYLGGPTSEENP